MKKPCFLLTSLMASLLSATIMYADNGVITNTVLNATDISGLEITNCSSNYWLSAEDLNNIIIIRNPALWQFATLNGIEIGIKYSEFSSTNLAINGLIGRKMNINTVFEEGMWDGATHQIIGDLAWHHESWFYRKIKGGNGDVVLLLVSNTTCLSISCDKGDEATQKSVCEQIALKIVEKIQQGCHVIVSDENPPPHTQPAP